MLKKLENKENNRKLQTNVSLDDFVPKNHIVRYLDQIDLSFIYDIVEPLYAKNGPESIDPVVIFKILIIQKMFNIGSIRETIEQIQYNLAYRWYLGYNLYDKIPDHSTISKLYERKFSKSTIFNDIFNNILELINNNDLIDKSEVSCDSTPVAASAHRCNMEYVEENVYSPYQKMIDDAVTEKRVLHNQVPLKELTTIPTRTIKKSKTDPDCGLFRKDDHKVDCAYLVSAVCDKNRYVLGCNVHAGNVHDSKAFFDLFQLIKNDNDIKFLIADTGYSSGSIAKMIIDNGMIPIIPSKKQKTENNKFDIKKFKYNEEEDNFTCPNNETLEYCNTNRSGQVHYSCNPNICKNCIYKNQCCGIDKENKELSVNIFYEYSKISNENVHKYHDIYNQRSWRIELVFADGKENHGLRSTRLRGTQKVKDSMSLTFACMNIKKYIKWMKKQNQESSIYYVFVFVLIKNCSNYE